MRKIWFFCMGIYVASLWLNSKVWLYGPVRAIHVVASLAVMISFAIAIAGEEKITKAVVIVLILAALVSLLFALRFVSSNFVWVLFFLLIPVMLPLWGFSSWMGDGLYELFGVYDLPFMISCVLSIVSVAALAGVIRFFRRVHHG